MKKTVIILGAVLATFGNSIKASNHNLLFNSQSEYIAFEFSPLHTAISKGDIESVKKFIEYGADVNKLSKDMSPLMVAARYNKFEIIKILLINGAHALDKNEKGFTALNYAEFSKAAEAIAILKEQK